MNNSSGKFPETDWMRVPGDDPVFAAALLASARRLASNEQMEQLALRAGPGRRIYARSLARDLAVAVVERPEGIAAGYRIVERAALRYLAQARFAPAPDAMTPAGQREIRMFDLAIAQIQAESCELHETALVEQLLRIRQACDIAIEQGWTPVYELSSVQAGDRLVLFAPGTRGLVTVDLSLQAGDQPERLCGRDQSTGLTFALNSLILRLPAFRVPAARTCSIEGLTIRAAAMRQPPEGYHSGQS